MEAQGIHRVLSEVCLMVLGRSNTHPPAMVMVNLVTMAHFLFRRSEQTIDQDPQSGALVYVHFASTYMVIRFTVDQNRLG